MANSFSQVTTILHFPHPMELPLIFPNREHFIDVEYNGTRTLIRFDYEHVMRFELHQCTDVRGNYRTYAIHGWTEVIASYVSELVFEPFGITETHGSYARRLIH